MEHAKPTARAIFDHATEIPSPAGRRAYVAEACGDDAELLRRVDALLAAYDEAGSFLETPAAAVAGTLSLDIAGTAEWHPEPEAPPPLREGPGSVIGSYKLLEQIGEGGMGVVFLAEQTRPVRRQVALKVVKAGMDTRQVVARFEAERQALALMDHPGIAKVFDGGATASGRPYFVMELVKGVPITRYCDDHRLTPRERLELFVHVCSAVQHAHTKGVIHRDLKPTNVLVALYDGKPVPKVIDFGVAKATGQRLTELTMFTGLGAVVGTPEYMSPEQAEMNQLDIDTRSDIYCLGVLLYELLTGTTPIEHKRVKEAALLEVLRVIREEDPPRPSTRLTTIDQLPSIAAQRGVEPAKLASTVRGELDWIVMKALEKDRNRRYETANGLARDVERYLRDEPVAACPPSATYRLRKAARRHRAALIAGAAFVALLVAATAVSSLLAVRATRAEQQVTRQRDQVQDALAQKEQALDRATQSERTARERLAKQFVALGDAALAAGRPSAREQYGEGLAMARELNLSDLPATTGLLVSYIKQPPPLMGSDGKRGGVGGFSGMRGWVALALVPDDRSVICATSSGQVSVFDVATGAVKRSFQQKGESFRDVALSRDGRTILTGSGQGTLKLWELETGKVLRSFGAHESSIGGVDLSPDGRHAVSGSTDKTVKVWDLAEGKEICHFTAPSHVYDVKFSPDGTKVLSVGEPDAVVLWDLETRRAIHTLEEGSVSAVFSVQFSPDGKTALTGSLGHGVVLWDLEAGKPIRTFVGHRGRVTDVAFLRDARTIVSGSGDGSLRLWDVSSGRELMAWRHDVRSLCVSHDGRFVMSGGVDGSLKLWNIQENTDTPTLRGPTNRVVSLAAAIEGRVVLSASFDNTIRLWDALTGLPIRTLSTGTTHPWGVSLSRDGRRALSSHEDGTVALWDMRTGGQIRTFKAHTDVATSVAHSPDEHTALSCSSDQTIKLWDLDSGELLRTLKGHTHKVRNVIFSRDGARALSASHDGTIKLWDVSTGKEIHTFAGHRHWVHAVTFAPDERTFASCGWDYAFGLWDIDSRKPLYFKQPATDIVLGVAFSPDGNLLLSGSLDGNVVMWDVKNRAHVRDFRIDSQPESPGPGPGASGWGQYNGITSVAFVRDGLAAVAGSRNGTIRRWRFDLPARHEEFAGSIPKARDALAKNPDDADALATFGRWYAFRGVHDWAVDFLERARARGAEISSLELARCYWHLGRLAEAARDFQLALDRREAPTEYLELCLSAAVNPPREPFPTTAPSSQPSPPTTGPTTAPGSTAVEPTR